MAAELFPGTRPAELPPIGATVIETPTGRGWRPAEERPRFTVVAHGCAYPEHACPRGAVAVTIERDGYRYCLDARELEVVELWTIPRPACDCDLPTADPQWHRDTCASRRTL